MTMTTALLTPLLVGLAVLPATPHSAVSQVVAPQSLSDAARTPEGLIRALYDMASFDSGPEPVWEMFRDVLLEKAIPEGIGG